MPLIKYNQANTYTCKGITLMPGLNRVKDDKNAEEFLEHPGVVARVKNGTIEVMDGKVKEAKELTAKELIVQVGGIMDVEVLRGMLEGEERSTVIKALEEQIELITEE